MNQFTTIFWDVDGTLLDFEYSQRQSIIKCFQTNGREVTEDMILRYSQINDMFWKRLELGEVSKQELLIGRFIQLFQEYDIRDIDVETFRQQYQIELGKVYRYIDDSLHICKALAGKMKQYVVTNGVTSTQKNKLNLSGLSDFMDDLFISEQIGTPKPQKEFFDYCLAHVQEQKKEKILLVGDSLTSDIKGGVLAGIPTCWYRPEGTQNTTAYKPDYEISELHQIFDILKVPDETQ